MNTISDPTISACLIVKNEEKVLATCLKSIRDQVDEIIVVDTGSIDQTIAIAQSFGAKIFHHPWENHFSKHRNQSLSYAEKEWILIIDADEEWVRENGLSLKEALRLDESIDAVTIVLECFFGKSGSKSAANSIRLFRNQRGIHYAGRVHNYLKGVKKAVCTSMRILHHGFILDRPTQIRRFKRTTELLKQDIAEDPGNPRPHHFLAASYLTENMLAEAAQEAEQAMALEEITGAHSPTYLWSLYIAASAYMDLGQIVKAEALAQKGLHHNQDHLDSHYLLALIAYRKKDLARFQDHLSHYLDIKVRILSTPACFGEMVHNTFTSQWLLHLLKAFLYDKADPDRFQSELDQSSKLCPDPFLYHYRLGTLFAQNHDLSQAESRFIRALEIKPEDPSMLRAMAYIQEEKKDYPSQITWLKRLIDQDPRFPNAYFDLALAHMRRNDFSAALSCFQKAWEIAPENRLITLNMALCLRGMAKYTDSIQMAESFKAQGDQEELIRTMNLAHCHYALGQYDQARLFFEKWSELQSRDPEPSVYLAELALERMDFEACVQICDKLLRRLDLHTDLVLNNLPELGALFSLAGSALSDRGRPDLAKITLAISRRLGYTPLAPDPTP